jgi:hypothetical protein
MKHSMKAHPSNRTRAVSASLIVAGLCAMPAARADVYTWIDADGNVNVGNLRPPESARILGVTRENPAAKAQAAAAREAARQDEVKALAQRVAELESKAQAAFDAPPAVYHAPPVSYAPTASYPPPQVNVVVMPAEQPDATAAYAPYGCAWVGCAMPWTPFVYPGAIVVTPSRHGRHDVHRRPSRPVQAPPGVVRQPRVMQPPLKVPMATQVGGPRLRG